MSRSGCLSRIELYKKYNNKALLEQEELFFSENYEAEPKEPEVEKVEPKAEKKEKVKKNEEFSEKNVG